MIHANQILHILASSDNCPGVIVTIPLFDVAAIQIFHRTCGIVASRWFGDGETDEEVGNGYPPGALVSSGGGRVDAIFALVQSGGLGAEVVDDF